MRETSHMEMFGRQLIFARAGQRRIALILEKWRSEESKSYSGPLKGPRGPHNVFVWPTPLLNPVNGELASSLVRPSVAV
jgi:hypothetical protein